MKKLKTHVKWIYLRRKTRMRKSYGGSRKLNTSEELIKNILIKIASDPKNTILTLPDSRYVYLQSEDKNYSIILSENRVKIANHQIFIETSVDPFFSQRLFKITFRYIEKYENQVNKTTNENEIVGG